MAWVHCSLRALCALRANPVFPDIYKSVSRRRKKKKRLRRDALVRYREVTRGLTSEAHEVSRYALGTPGNAWERHTLVWHRFTVLSVPSVRTLFYFQDLPTGSRRPRIFFNLFSVPSV